MPILLTVNAYTFPQLNEDVAISCFLKSKNIPIFHLENLENYKLNYQIIDENESNIDSPHHIHHNLEINENTKTDDILYFRIKNATFERDIFIAKKSILICDY